MKVFLGADHRGYELKNKLINWLEENDYEAEDCGATSYTPTDDYPDFAKAVGEKVTKENGSMGVVICGSGAGVSIAANKVKGIRSAIGFDKKQITDAREHDDLNVLSLPANFINDDQAKEFVRTFLETKYEDTQNHTRRINKLD